MKPFRVEGLLALDKALADLPKAATAKRVVVKTLSDAARPIAENAASLARVDRGDLKASFGVGTRLTRRQAALHKKESDVEVFAGSGGKGGTPVQSITEEFGTREVTANPMLRPAWDGGKLRALEEIKDGLAANIEKAAKRAAKRAGR